MLAARIFPVSHTKVQNAGGERETEYVRGMRTMVKKAGMDSP